MRWTRETAENWLERREGEIKEFAKADGPNEPYVEFYAPFSPQFAREVRETFENVSISTGTHTVQVREPALSNADFVRMRTTLLFWD